MRATIMNRTSLALWASAWRAGAVAALAFAAVVAAAAEGVADDSLTKNIEIKEGARTMVRLVDVSSFFVQDPAVVKMTDMDENGKYILDGLGIGNTNVICTRSDGKDMVLKVTVVPRYWSTLRFLFQDMPNISLNITDGHVIISGKTIQNSIVKKVDQAVALDKKRIINNVVLSHTDLLKRINCYLRGESLNGIKAEVMDKTIYLNGKIYDKSKRDKLLSVVESYAKPAGFALNSSGIILSGSPLIVDVRFVTVTRGKDDNLGLTMNEIKYSMEFDPSASHAYDNSATPNVTKKAAYGGTGNVATNGVLNIQKIRNAMKVLFDSKLATRSGEVAELQRGGTVYEKIEGVQAVDLKEIDYGFMVKVTPTMVNENTITADVSVQVSGIQSQVPLTINKYHMAAKYTIAPGEVIVINKMNAINDRISEQGVLGLSDIPFVGSLFDTDVAQTANADILLLLRITRQTDFERAAEAEKAEKKFEEARDTPTTVDMNLSDKVVKEVIDKLEEE